MVKEFASPVFRPQTKPNAKPHHGVPGHVGEWLWYLLALETPDLPGRTTEYLAEPKVNVNDGGGDGRIIRRTRSGSGPELVFRLWEMKKYTGKDDSITATVTGAWQQLSENGAAYVLSQTAWADREFAGDLGAFVSQMVEMWIDGHPSSGAGVSVATNTSAAPTEAFATSHTHKARDRPQRLRRGSKRHRKTSAGTEHVKADHARPRGLGGVTSAGAEQISPGRAR